ncbi:hypothetical protein HMPREF3207_01648 [Citrobacter koseri]|nr:hypothetical protein HMPREF3207_01648 [Citrobacter koseri]
MCELAGWRRWRVLSGLQAGGCVNIAGWRRWRILSGLQAGVRVV